MNAEVKALWVKALRSGQYVQGESYLHRVTQNEGALYCCLGVLCDLAVKAGVLPPPIQGRNDEQEPVFAYGKDRQKAELPVEVMDWAGITSTDGGYSATNSLVNDNDSGEVDFSQIADIIEKHF